jgi:hypothetical protein
MINKTNNEIAQSIKKRQKYQDHPKLVVENIIMKDMLNTYKSSQIWLDFVSWLIVS